MNMDIFLTNNLNNKKEKFVPINKENIGMYVCGPTVYDNPHIGNARPLVIFDILFKVLKSKYGHDKINYIRNITDVDDKIIKSAKEKNLSISELTNNVIKDFNDDCNYLNLDNPTQQPKATDHIDLMIKMISTLIEKDFAYEANNHVYFEVSKFDDYGKLSNKKLEDLIAGSRVEVSDNKKKSEDFVLWKPSKDDEPSWDSPWGKGRPGWHLECSAMSKKYLGNIFDIHGGGMDLKFPHHECEIAQSRCATGSSAFARHWFHTRHLVVEGDQVRSTSCGEPDERRLPTALTPQRYTARRGKPLLRIGAGSNHDRVTAHRRRYGPGDGQIGQVLPVAGAGAVVAKDCIHPQRITGENRSTPATRSLKRRTRTRSVLCQYVAGGARRRKGACVISHLVHRPSADDRSCNPLGCVYCD